ncbi:MAG: HAMP domain-containing histidine kinase [Phycisphaerae bacterium]|nr:HAMP domain-containing histidine kinase [Phycisphaerae bacterium]
MPDSERKSVALWSRTSQWAAALAVLLAGAGLALAIRQTRAIPIQRIAELRPDAARLAVEINAEIVRQTRIALQGVAGQCRTTQPAKPVDSPGYPTWIPLLFAFEGEELREVSRLPGSAQVSFVDSDYEGFMELVGPRLRALWQIRDRSAGEVRFIHENVGGRPVVIAALLPENGETPIITAGLLDVFLLERAVLYPLLNPYMNLEVRVSSRKVSAWAESLGPALPFLTIQPSAVFVSAQRSSAFRRTLVYVAIMLLVLAALLMLMRATTRVARRELELSRLKSEFVADVSHELKTPLALIQMFGETLLEGRVRSEGKKQEYYEIITRESKRLTHLINNILDFARIDSGKKIYKLQRVRMETIARNVYEVYRHELDRKGFEHELIVADGLPEIEADPDSIAQVLLNLISNAIKYSENERHLEVELSHETRRGRRGVLISMRDRGIGISPEDRAYLFDGFFRAQDDKVRKQRGAGLGLSLTRDIVEAHGGFVEVESRLIKGTTFHVFLPACREPHKEETNG